ncbi:MAG: 3-deoxy-7-phosphoheptulonate synthase [Eubacteriales bacterium]|nr:3-deoxy-7-phosphoheptulonate synthase [Eubacteriales bacterium]
MIVILKPNSTQEQKDKVISILKQYPVDLNISEGVECTLIGLVGDTSAVDIDRISTIDYIDKVMKVSEPFKKSNRKFHPDNTVIDVGGVKIGGEQVVVMAGPCSVESKEQMEETANGVKNAGARILRGGAFKPRSSPYSFQGLEEEGIELLEYAKDKTGMPIVTELLSANMVEKYADRVDIIQVGARNMQNFDLLRACGRTDKPILLKRGLSSTIEELLMSAEYIMAEGNPNVILCERGIRTFETYTRNTLDIGAVPALKRLSHLPVVIDPSHACGKAWMVPSLAKAAVAAGADGLIIEVHNCPECAKCDGQQSLTPADFQTLMAQLQIIAQVEGRTI